MKFSMPQGKSLPRILLPNIFFPKVTPLLLRKHTDTCRKGRRNYKSVPKQRYHPPRKFENRKTYSQSHKPANTLFTIFKQVILMAILIKRNPQKICNHFHMY